MRNLLSLYATYTNNLIVLNDNSTGFCRLDRDKFVLDDINIVNNKSVILLPLFVSETRLAEIHRDLESLIRKGYKIGRHGKGIKRAGKAVHSLGIVTVQPETATLDGYVIGHAIRQCYGNAE